MAKFLVNEAPGGKRTPLKDLVPLRTPLVLQIFPIYLCNFKCKYCTFSIEKKKRGFISDEIIMNPNLYKKCVDDATTFNDQIKVVRFVGMGEPLLHKKLSDMIKYTSDNEIAKGIEVITNASLLTPKMSDQLINAGLTKLLISIQGVNEERYYEVSKAKIKFDNFISNIKYFFEHKGDVKIHIKIVDCALKDKNEEEKFFDIFSPICDTIGIEIAGPIHEGVEYNDELKKNFFTKNQFGIDSIDIKICPQPFYMMQINPDGKIVSCYSLTYPEIFGNCNKESIVDVWNGEKFNNFRYKMLDGMSNTCKICKKCNIIKHRSFKEDDLTEVIEKLRLIYGNKKKLSNL